MYAKHVILRLAFLLLSVVICEFADCKKIENITAAIETLMPEQKDVGQYTFEDIALAPELAFEFSNAAFQSINYYIVLIAVALHAFVWCIFRIN